MKQTIFALAFACSCTLTTNATSIYSSCAYTVAACTSVSDENVVHFSVLPVDNSNKGLPDRKSLVLIPEVTLDGHTLHFITPCTGLTLQLVQDDEVCYETVITSDYLEIPAGITGMYELQILRGDYIFFAEVEL